MEYNLMNTGTNIARIAAIGAICLAPVMSQAQPKNPWIASPTAAPAPAPVAPPTPKVMPKYFVEAPQPSFEEIAAAPAGTPTPSRFAPADLDNQLALASQRPASMPPAFGSVLQNTPPATVYAPPAAQQPIYNSAVPNGYVAPVPYGNAGGPNGYSTGYYPTQQPYGSNGFPWGGNNSWPSFGNLPFGGSPNFGFW